MDADQRRRTAATWDAGNYPDLAERLAPASVTLAAAAGAGGGRAAVDVAAGTGSLAHELAADGWRTTALDIAPSLVARGRQRAASLGLDVTWHEGSLDELPLPDRSQDLVGSSFGMIFAPDPSAALAEAARVLGDDGRLLLATWPVDGYLAEMTRVMGTFMPPGTPIDGPFHWGDPEVLAGWLAEHFTEARTTVHELPWTFADVDSAVEFLFEASPGHVAAEASVGDRAPQMHSAVADHLTEVNGSTGPVDLRLRFRLTEATVRR